MIVIIAGSRNLKPSLEDIDAAVAASSFGPTEIVTGGAPGVDTRAFDWAWARGIPVRTFVADWKTYGRAAGPIRNAKMAEYAEALIAFPGGRGTKNMIETAYSHGLAVYEVSS